MLLETCQLLCGVHEHAPYKRTHYNHPCAKWARQCKANYNWLEELGNALSSEYTARRGRIHACDVVLDWLANNEPELHEGPMTEWPQCMPDEYKHSNVITAYNNYYAAKLADFALRGIK
jgi:hypothetical protein